MFEQIIIFTSVVLIVLTVPGFDNSMDAIKSGSFFNEYVLQAIFYSYAFGVASGYIIFILLKKVFCIRRRCLFFIQLAMAILASFVMIIYTMALMVV